MGVSLDDFAKKAVEASLRRRNGYDVRIVGCKSADPQFGSMEHVCKIDLGAFCVYAEFYMFEGESMAETLLEAVPQVLSGFDSIRGAKAGAFCNTFVESQLFKKYRYEGMVFSHHDIIRRYGEANIDAVVASRMDGALKALPLGSSFDEVFGYVLSDCDQRDFFGQLVEVSGAGSHSAR